MFDLITGNQARPLRERTFGSKMISITVHAVVVTLVVVVPLLRVTNTLPPMPTMMAFVTSAPAPPPPPPPPPPAAAPKPAATPAPHATTATANPSAAPIAPPPEIAPETGRVATAAAAGGVEGGVEGGVTGGIVGGLTGDALPPPPPPPPAAARGPVRIGGQITAPALIKRVEPTYPDVAAAAQLTGLVILEATVGVDGYVVAVRVLRSRTLFLDKAASDALKQWQYSPLVLNGIATPFLLTVTFNFRVGR